MVDKLALLAYLVFLHFIADFILQSREMGKKKSEDIGYLSIHLLIQFLVILIGVTPFFDRELSLGIAISNTIIHGIIDFSIWRVYKFTALCRIASEAKEFHCTDVERKKWIAESARNWQYWEDHWFYTFIGLDQMLHVLTLIGIVSLL